MIPKIKLNYFKKFVKHFDTDWHYIKGYKDDKEILTWYFCETNGCPKNCVMYEDCSPESASLTSEEYNELKELYPEYFI